MSECVRVHVCVSVCVWCAPGMPGVLRLRGGGQGWYMDEVQKQQKRGRVLSSHGEGKHVFDVMMSLEHFPETLDPVPLSTALNPINEDPLTYPDQVRSPASVRSPPRACV